MVLALLLLLLAPAIAQDQDKDKENARPPKRGDTVIAKGCLRGSALENADLSRAEGTGRSSEIFTYRLSGDKKIIKEIRDEHDGHADVVTAELKTDLPTSSGFGKRIGNSRITIGGSRGMGPEPPPPMPQLRVISFEHTGVTCR